MTQHNQQGTPDIIESGSIIESVTIVVQLCADDAVL